MNDQLHQAGVKLLRQLGRHAELLMDVYQAGEVNEAEQKIETLTKLEDAGILWRPEPDQPLRLKQRVRAFLEEALSDERNRQIETNANAAMMTLTTLVGHYTESAQRYDYSAVEAYLADLTEHVYRFSEQLRYAIRVLWGRINHEFGYVTTLNAKIRENQLAQSQVSELLTGLEAIDFHQLDQLANDDRALRRLLITHLQGSVSSCIHELAAVQTSLLELFGRFRQYQGRTRLLKGWQLHNELHPNYRPLDQTVHKFVPSLLNRADCIIQPAFADVRQEAHEQSLFEIIAQAKAMVRLPQSMRAQTAAAVQLTDFAEYEAPDNRLALAVEDYFSSIVDVAGRKSALDYWDHHQLPWNREAWIYQVIAGFEGLSTDYQGFFELEIMGYPDPIFTGNFIIEDVDIWLA